MAFKTFVCTVLHLHLLNFQHACRPMTRKAVVLKLKHYIGPDTRPVVVDEILKALFHNENCEALYIQNLSDGMLDPQLEFLSRVLR